MEFNSEVIQILKNFSSINQSIVFKPGNVLSTISPAKTIMAKAKIKQEIPSTFAIYELSRFLGTLSMFENPTIDICDTNMLIKEGKRKINYTFTEPSLIISPPDKDIVFPEAEVVFNITQNDLAEVTKALSILSLPEFAVTGDGKSVYVQAIDSKYHRMDFYSIEVGETNDIFRMIISAENLKVIPDNYQVKISSKGLSHFKSDTIDYYISVESNSTYGN